MVSPAGFTAPAVRYARDEGIGLAELRPAEPAEDNRVKAIHFRGAMRVMGDPTIEWKAADDAERDRANRLLASRLGAELTVSTDSEVLDSNGKLVGDLQSVLSKVFNSLRLAVGTNDGEWTFEEILRVEVADVRVAVKGFSYSVQVYEASHNFTIGNPDSVAALIIQSVEGAAPMALDRVIYDTDLRSLAFDADGRVVRRPNLRSSPSGFPSAPQQVYTRAACGAPASHLLPIGGVSAGHPVSDGA